jgi:uncharacterized protein YgbK (DUF1537 family)
VTTVAFFADDFTGATDVLLQAIRLGRSATLFLEQPDEAALCAAVNTDVVGIASVARALGVTEIRDIVGPGLALLGKTNPQFVQYKICSTADSSPERGSIQPAFDVGAALYGNQPVPILVAQPGLGRFTVFSNHYATDQGAVQRLDRVPAMRDHPATPMREADLRRHFALQLGRDVDALSILELRLNPAPAPAPTAAAYVIDALDDDDLVAAGRHLMESSHRGRPRFVVGSGGLTRAILLSAAGRAEVPPAIQARRTGPVLAVSGSGAPETSRQIDAAIGSGWKALYLNPISIRDDANSLHKIIGEACRALEAGQPTVVYTTHSTLAPRGDFVEASMIGASLAAVIESVAQTVPLDRVIIAGGDTSGYTLQTLGARRLDAVGEVEGNLLLGRIYSASPDLNAIEVVLKGGQLGRRTVFEDARTAGVRVTYSMID